MEIHVSFDWEHSSGVVTKQQHKNGNKGKLCVVGNLENVQYAIVHNELEVPCTLPTLSIL